MNMSWDEIIDSQNTKNTIPCSIFTVGLFIR